MEEGGQSLVFAVNGERFEFQSIDPSTTLLEFLRLHTRFKSVKLGCGEGGCGACVVLLSKYEPTTDQVESYAVSSCLTLVCSLNGCSITTSEGLGNSKDGFHTIHQRFAGFHASQCGFCTPGMCMSLFSALVKADNKTNQLEQSPGFSKISVTEAEKSISGHLCRCTGYRPIVDVCKSFAHDMDIEDLGLNSFWKKGDSKKVSGLPLYKSVDQSNAFPKFLKNNTLKSSFVLHCKNGSWYSPRTMEELQGLLQLNESNRTVAKLVVSNTGTGYYKEWEKYDKYIDLSYIHELSSLETDEKGIHIGAAVSISKATELLKEGNSEIFNDETVLMFRKIAAHFEKVASKFIRNSASVGGNLIMAKRKQFPSDLATVLVAVGSTVDIMVGTKLETQTLEEFLEGPALDPKSLLVRVNIPSWEPVCDSASRSKKSGLVFETYRASPRPLGSALPYLNAAFLAEVYVEENLNRIVINHVKLGFGAFGCKHAIRARKVEEFLVGKTLDDHVLYEATKLVLAEVVPADGISHASYRSSLASAFLFEFLHPLVEACAQMSGTGINGCTDLLSAILSRVFEMYEQFKLYTDTPLLLPAKQEIGPAGGEFRPVGEPVIKTGAALQASGEAVYVDDIPAPTNCLHGAFIYSTKPMARVKGVKFESGKLPEGVDAVISFKDIPKGGKNIGSMALADGEPLFADELTIYAGQPIALVVANTQKQADIAANLALVEYDLDNLDPPILTVEEAVERSSFYELYPFASPKPVGDISKGMDEADHKISAEIRLPSQYYFYMENQSSLAIPDEDNCMVVYSSSQCPEMTQTVIARCLDIPEHNVRVITRRVGGGFGGKGYRAMPVATACALASYTLHRPVRMYLNRKTDMIMAGGRHPMQITYNIGFKSDGKVTALHLNILINAGISEDYSPLMPMSIVNSLKKYNWGALSFDIKVCKTNHTSKSAMRAPGEVQGSFIAESVIEYVASTLSIDVDIVRAKNIHSYESLQLFYKNSEGEPDEYTLPSVWDKLALSSSYHQRVGMVKEFNESHIWKKRGISRIPVVVQLSVRASPGRVSILADGSIVVEVGGIEIGQGLWTKVTQMVAFGLRPIQCNGAADDLLDKVRVVQADTLSVVQGGLTAGSTTSESSCEAVRICCTLLVQRLTPFKDKLQEQMGSVNWNTLIAQAHAQSVSLSASSLYVPDPSSMQYLNYGAAVSEVELNLLTGETMMLRSDILYDCGQSLNPAVDLGQIEGAFVQGIGFFMMEEYLANSDGLMIADSTWNYKIPTFDTIPKQLNVEILNSGHHQKRVLSSKASGEPPLLLAASVHCATRAAVKEARKQISSWVGLTDSGQDSIFQLSVPATMPAVKELCGLDVVQNYLKYKLTCSTTLG